MGLGIERTLKLLADAPRRIGAATQAVEPQRLRTAPADGDWSANEVLAHLRACADMWGGSIVRILAEDRPTLRAINPRTWIKRTDYLQLEFQPSFQAYAAQRAELLSLLEPLPEDGWSRSAAVTGAGKVLQRSVLFYAEWLASHERAHVIQIERVAGAVSRAYAAPDRSSGR